MKVIAVTIGTLAALSIFLTVRYRRRRRSQNGPPSFCYLHGDQKPQHAFKRVLADNSYSPFKHLKLHDSQNGTVFLKLCLVARKIKLRNGNF